MYVVYLSCDFVTKMIIKEFWKSSLISGLWFGKVQFLNRNIQAWNQFQVASDYGTHFDAFRFVNVWHRNYYQGKQLEIYM